MKTLYDACARLLDGGEDVVMATIVNKQGSAPRSTGAKMLVQRNTDTVGTIGGGLLEAKVVLDADEVFHTGHSVIRRYDLTGTDVAATDMICGGRVEVFIDYLSSSAPWNAEIFFALDHLYRNGGNAVLVRALAAVASGQVGFNHCLLFPDGRQTGFPIAGPLSDRLFQETQDGALKPVRVDGTDYFVEPIRSLGVVYLFGAGHVAQQVARLTSMVDFRTVVLDDRADFASRERFPDADELVAVDGFEQCIKDLPIAQDSYLVIVTRGHLHDLTVLAQAVKSEACYIGLISSRRKREMLYRALRESGVADEELKRVHSPIGVDIGAQTPEEIAVSIVAELIQVRGKRRGAKR
ncbi:XdhC family protein [Alicyclobacillus tolerans]|uniref:XdhC family aldehyde oxidoreductase maturation factor n=1 Tax=Alicyclobacillus tolerans TaxID=90970 RepID=UPI001F197C77|nr:XdhC/CoxI family protein [Alicyclobacillus tolerans]MCF8567245.1 XdhC family protein [Alicyclobacillus tolerans]